MSRPKSLFWILSLRCEEASLLSSREVDEPLALSERIALRGHRLVCRSCRRFGRQVRFLHQALRDRPGRSPEDDTLSAQARERIEEMIIRSSVDDFPSGPPG